MTHFTCMKLVAGRTTELETENVHGRLPFQARVQLVDGLPNSIICVLDIKAFKYRLKKVADEFYSADESIVQTLEGSRNQQTDKGKSGLNE